MNGLNVTKLRHETDEPYSTKGAKLSLYQTPHRIMKLVLSILLFAGIGACLIAYALPDTFTATALIEIKPAFVGASLRDGTFSAVSAEGEIIESVISSAGSDLVKQKLADIEGFEPEFDLSKIIDPVLKVQRSELAHCIAVGVTLRKPDQAAKLANDIANILVDQYNRLRTETEAAALKRSENMIAALWKASTLSARAASDYRALHDVGQANRDRVADLEQKVFSLQNKLDAAQARYESLKHATPDAPAVSVEMTNGLMPYLREQYAEQKQQFSKLSVIYGAQHPHMQQMEQSLHVLNSQMNAELARLTATALDEAEALRKQVSALQADIAHQSANIRTSDAVRAEMNRLDEQAALEKTTYERFSQNQSIFKHEYDLQQPVVGIGLLAHRPAKANTQHFLLFLSISAGLAALSGTLAALFWRGSDRNIDSPPANMTSEKTRQEPEFPSSVPFSPDRAEVDDIGLFKPDYTIGELQPPLRAPLRSNAALLNVADARAVLKPLLPEVLQLANRIRPHLVAIMALPGARGKTSVAVALAHLAADTGLSVLVISDHGQTGEIEPGLLDVVSRKTNPRELTLHDPLSDFMIMRTGCSVAEDFWQLSQHRNFSSVMQAIKDSWDLVLLELPCLPQTGAPHIPATLFDMLLLLFRPDVQKSADIERSKSACATALAAPVVTLANTGPK
jgi:uncharacterized protein involved in exopolysaccharide biosynthesis/Mrp family chromosome partitioning ATPase